jgi:phosphoribosylformylglycinamidine synthase II
MNLIQKCSSLFELFEIKLYGASDKQLVQISAELGIGLNLEEMKTAQKYFSEKRRDPTDIELQTIGQTWSEHCYHKTFKGEITFGKKKIKSLFKTYIAKATEELNPSWCVSVFEDNAGIVDFHKAFAVAAKVETHNHPSAVEPFGGAATGTGGVIRDILGVWADPIACTDVLGFGPINYEYDKLPLGIKHPKYVYRGVVAGIGCYGNNMGIPTVNGAIYFDESYVGNVVVYCGCIGLLPKNKYVKNIKPGDVILIVGGKTGREGIHGVTFASAELTEKSEEVSRPAVQIANPIEEEKLKRAIIEVRDQGLASGITDLGGGGLSSAVGEKAHNSSCGVYVELDKIPLKYLGMAPWEIFLSESQERMLLSVPRKNLTKVFQIFQQEDVESTPIGKFTDNQVLILDYQGARVAEIDISFLFEPPTIKRYAKWERPDYKEPNFEEPNNLTKIVLEIFSQPNVASKESVIRTYDHEVKGNTVIKPLHGKHTGPNDAAIIKPLNNSWKGAVISCGMNPNYGKIDTYWMAASNIDEAIRNNTAVGGKRIALLDNFTWGNPEKPEQLGSLVRACQACYHFAKGFGTPFISGKDSLYNESPTGAVTPTLLITAVGIIQDVRKAVSIDLKQPGNPIYILGKTLPEFGGSEYYKLKGLIGKTVPKVNVSAAKTRIERLVKAMNLGYVKACHDLSEGGLAIAAAEMALTSEYGIELLMKKVPKHKNMKREDLALFSESNSRFLVEVIEKRKQDFETLMKGNDFSVIGRVTKGPYFSVYGLNNERIIDASIAAIRERWKRTLRGFD